MNQERDITPQEIVDLVNEKVFGRDEIHLDESERFYFSRFPNHKFSYPLRSFVRILEQECILESIRELIPERVDEIKRGFEEVREILKDRS